MNFLRTSAVVHVLDADRNAVLELDRDAVALDGDRLGIGGELVHVGERRRLGVLEHAGLVRDVEQVLVGRPRLVLGLRHGDALLLGVLEKILAAAEALGELWRRRKER